VKLYWRVKRNGKWTWRPAKVTSEIQTTAKTTVYYIQMEEEE